MSSTTIVSLSLSELAEKVLALEARIALLESSHSVKPAAKAAGKAGKTKKVRDPNAPKRPPSEHALFTKRISGLLRENGYTGLDLSTLNMQFCKTLRDENPDLSVLSDADILARRSAWTAPTVSEKEKKDASAANSVVSEKAESVVSEKKKAVRKTKKAAAPVSAVAAPAAVAATVAVAVPAEKKKAVRKTKKAAAAEAEAVDASNAAAAATAAAIESVAAVNAILATSAAVPVAEDAAAPVSKFEKIRLQGGKPYLVNFATGHAYHRLADDSQGEWAGMFVKVPKPHIDDSVAEPVAEEEESAGYTVE
jgi:hypothetical protein